MMTHAPPLQSPVSAMHAAGRMNKRSPAVASPELERPVAIASGRLFGVSVLLGVLALTSTVLVITRLFESWQVTSGPASHLISVFGQRLSYPAANAGAIVVTVLAGL